MLLYGKKKNNLKINHLNDNYKILSFSIHLASKHLVAISKKQTNNNKKICDIYDAGEIH